MEGILAADQTLTSQRHRLRPRVISLLRATEDDLLEWGEQNLQAVQSESLAMAKALKDLSQLEVQSWLDRCIAAARKPPSLLGKLLNQEDPMLYEKNLRRIQAELKILRKKISELKDEIEPDVTDLRLDAATLAAVRQEFTDATRQTIADRRHRILVAGQQAVAQLVASAEACKGTVTDQMQTLDQMLTVTIPAWVGGSAGRLR